jgi:hypothetical protein
MVVSGHEPVTVKFTLTVPYTMAGDSFSIQFGNGDPEPMEQINEVTWSTRSG